MRKAALGKVSQELVRLRILRKMLGPKEVLGVAL